MAISRYRATTSGGPNFAYDLCVRKVTEEQKAGLDLSSWDVAFNGAEPVKGETLQRFAAAFAACGLRQRAYLPCYGLAETTLIACGCSKGSEPTFFGADAQALKAGSLVPATEDRQGGNELVGNGEAPTDHDIVIVDPEKRTPCSSDEVGEIWIAGPSVAQGYWNRPEESARTFRARLADTGEGPFLRTGDLGFLHAGQLFVTGRLKDLIIIRGLNHYPQDIERTVERSHQSLRRDCGAAFAVEIEGEERLVVVQEIERRYIKKLDAEAVIGAIRQSVSREHGIRVYAVMLIKTSSLPKTTSGKVQRHLCREYFSRGGLNVVAGSLAAAGHLQACTPRAYGFDSVDNETEDGSELTRVIQSSIAKKVADLLKITNPTVDVYCPLNTLGIDSLMAVELMTDIEEEWGVEFPVEALFLGAGIADLTAHVLWQRNVGKRTCSQRRAVGKAAVVRPADRRAGGEAWRP
jgi:acyl carrier protein